MVTTTVKMVVYGNIPPVVISAADMDLNHIASLLLPKSVPYSLCSKGPRTSFIYCNSTKVAYSGAKNSHS